MPPRVERLAADVASNMILLALSRLLVPLLVPAILGIVGVIWSLHGEQATMRVQLSALIEQSRAGTVADTAAATNSAVLAAGQTHILRTLDTITAQMQRVESRLDAHMAAHARDPR